MTTTPTAKARLRMWIHGMRPRDRIVAIKRRPWSPYWWDTRYRSVKKRGPIEFALDYRRQYVAGARGVC